jgi:hypothetical protein
MGTEYSLPKFRIVNLHKFASLLYKGYLGHFSGVKRPVREADPTPATSAEVKKTLDLQGPAGKLDSF